MVNQLRMALTMYGTWRGDAQLCEKCKLKDCKQKKKEERKYRKQKNNEKKKKYT